MEFGEDVRVILRGVVTIRSGDWVKGWTWKKAGVWMKGVVPVRTIDWDEG